MHIYRKPFKEVPQFSTKDVAYATADGRLQAFYKYPVQIDAFASVIADKAKDNTDRSLLVSELKAQFAQLPKNARVDQQLERLLEPPTFTVITAHQPCLFTGPLYFIYKICSTIHLANQLNAAYPKQHIVPVFITGGEDHDFEEINHLYLFGKRLSWDRPSGGAVAAMPTAELKPLLEEIAALLGDSEAAHEIFAKLHTAYTAYPTLGLSTLAFIHDLFGDFGLVTVDPSRPALKKAFLPIAKAEIFEQPSQAIVEQTQLALEAQGFTPQAHARDINFFYLRQGLRERIVLQPNGDYAVLNTSYLFSPAALTEELEQFPERFSPNVVMRPLFQELIFPNLAYVGGGGEIAYWLERKEQFAHFGINFPMLIRRNSVLWVDKTSQKRIEKLGISLHDLFGDLALFLREYVEKNSEHELSLATELQQLETLFHTIAQKADEIDPSLRKAVLAEHSRQAKAIENFEGRLRRTEKQRFDTALQQISALKEKLFPNNGMQERHDNFLGLYTQVGGELLPFLVENLNPLEPGLLIIEA